MEVRDPSAGKENSIFAPSGTGNRAERKLDSQSRTEGSLKSSSFMENVSSARPAGSLAINPWKAMQLLRILRFDYAWPLRLGLAVPVQGMHPCQTMQDIFIRGGKSFSIEKFFPVLLSLTRPDSEPIIPFRR